MERYKVAVVIPCWNCGQVIGETLKCIEQQTYEDWRLWCVDDQSTDNTQEVIQEFADRDSRIHLVVREREPKGAQTCRNTGFDLAEGAEYVIWFDSDDLIAPYCLEQRVRFMDAHSELDFGVFKAKSYFKDIYETEGCELFGYEYPGADNLKRMLCHTLPFVGWTNIYRRQSVVNKGLRWDENILSLQDSDFNIQSLLKGLRYEFAKELPIDYFYYVNHSSGSIANKIFTEGHQQSHLYFLNKLHETFTEDQRYRYRYELYDYLFYFINNFSGKSFTRKLHCLPWLKRRWWFMLRVDIYTALRGKSRHLLFPLVCNYNRRFVTSYWRGNKVQVKKETEKIKLLLKNWKQKK